MTKINILATRHSAFYSPLIGTIAGGYLEREGLEPDYKVADPKKPVAESLLEGAAHVAQSAASNGFTYLQKGEDPPVLHFAQINERDGFFLTGRKPEPDFNWSNLVGRTVLIDHGRQPLVMFKYAVHCMGVDYDAIEAVDVGGGGAELERAFRDGQGDYVHLQGPAPQQLEKDGVGHVVASVGETFGPLAFSSLVATPAWLETDMAKAFMRAFRAGKAWVASAPPAEIAAAEAGFFPKIDQGVLADCIAAYQKLGNWKPDPTIEPAHFEVMVDAFLHSGVIAQRYPHDKIICPPPDA